LLLRAQLLANDSADLRQRAGGGGFVSASPNRRLLWDRISGIHLYGSDQDYGKEESYAKKEKQPAVPIGAMHAGHVSGFIFSQVRVWLRLWIQSQGVQQQGIRQGLAVTNREIGCRQHDQRLWRKWRRTGGKMSGWWRKQNRCGRDKWGRMDRRGNEKVRKMKPGIKIKQLFFSGV
jgi:hypothetical protein